MNNFAPFEGNREVDRRECEGEFCRRLFSSHCTSLPVCAAVLYGCWHHLLHRGVLRFLLKLEPKQDLLSLERDRGRKIDLHGKETDLHMYFTRYRILTVESRSVAAQFPSCPILCLVSFLGMTALH